MQNTLPFKGRVALVTGASRGIGKAIARTLMQQGATVYVNSRNMSRAQISCSELSQNAVGGACVPIAADVSKRRQVRSMFDRITEENGRIDFLVNNAGVTSRLPLLDISDEHWDEILDINLRGVFLCTQTAVLHMKEKGFGRIVNAASYAAWHAGINRGVYAASKAGVVALTKVWAGELAPYGITINAYAPGDILTEMTADVRGSEEAVLLERIALHRFGNVDDVANVVSFLLSPSADYLTGTVVEISGGKFVVQNTADAWKTSTK